MKYVNKLIELGYSIVVKNNNLIFRYIGRSVTPPYELVSPLIEGIKRIKKKSLGI